MRLSIFELENAASSWLNRVSQNHSDSKDAAMNYSTYLALALSTLHSCEAALRDKLLDLFAGRLDSFIAVVLPFLSQPCSPQSTHQLETDLNQRLRELGRDIVQSLFNQVEGDDPEQAPSDIAFEGEYYHIDKTKRHQLVHTYFGDISLYRHIYRPSKSSVEPCLIPLNHALGLVENATPALADTACRYLAEAGANQQSAHDNLKTRHGVSMGTQTLRDLAKQDSDKMAKNRQEFQVQRILKLLEQAEASCGPFEPTLGVGRDGIYVRKYRNGNFECASVATISVKDSNSKRLGTVYLAFAPEPNQLQMTKELTALIEEVLRRWQGRTPRLVYVTDAGSNESKYYEKVLRPMVHPRTQEALCWQRIVDFYHVMEKIAAMAEAMFGKNSKEGRKWIKRMRRMLKEPDGAARVLRSAAATRRGRYLTKARREIYEEGRNYIRKRTQWMDYFDYARKGLPLGSGVTEAACKTVVAQRLKLSGMRWENEGAQVILNLRVVLLSKIWKEVYECGLEDSKHSRIIIRGEYREKPLQNAA
jgi:hypothetical protein